MSANPQSVPVEVRRLRGPNALEDTPGTGLEISWSTGEKTVINSKVLRSNCPCATCMEARGEQVHAKPLGGKSSLLKVISATADQELNLQAVWPVGNYALGIKWGDDHDTGIYTYPLLFELATKNSEKKEND